MEPREKFYHGPSIRMGSNTRPGAEISESNTFFRLSFLFLDMEIGSCVSMRGLGCFKRGMSAFVYF